MAAMKNTFGIPVLNLTPRLITLFIFISLGALNFGFDNGWWACVLPLDAFIRHYAPPGSTEIPSTWQSAGTGTANAGLVIGCLIAGAIGNKLGRKWSIILLVTIALIGMVIQNAIQSYWAVMVGRMVNAMSMGIEANVIPTYMAELAPPSVRGALVSFYQFWQFIGVLLAVLTVLGSRDTLPANGQWAFRTVMVVQLFIPLLLLGAVFFFPESPRWLLQRGRREEAKNALLFIRAGSDSLSTVDTELDLLETAIREQADHHAATSYKDCFRGSNGRRTFIAAGVQVMQQLQGNSFFTSYALLYMAQLGISDPLKAQPGRMACGLAGIIIGFVLLDRVGRRPLMLACSVGNWVTIWLSSGFSSWVDTESHTAVVRFCLACVLLWMVFNSLGWGSCVWIVTSEVPTLQLRERTISIATSCSFLAVLLISYINPFVQYEPGNLGARVGFVYGAFSLLSIGFVYFCLPECSGRSFEELDEMFQAGVPAWRFKGYTTTGVGAIITQVNGGGEVKGLARDTVSEEGRASS
ncbi:general substrate transporter [Aspergillus heterothallicus]